jgi:hypothetical protein
MNKLKVIIIVLISVLIGLLSTVAIVELKRARRECIELATIAEIIDVNHGVATVKLSNGSIETISTDAHIGEFRCVKYKEH